MGEKCVLCWLGLASKVITVLDFTLDSQLPGEHSVFDFMRERRLGARIVENAGFERT